MKKRITALVLSALLLIGASSALASSTAGSASDPLISLDYIADTYISLVLEKGRALISAATGSSGDSASTGSFTSVSLASGSRLTLGLGGSVILESGSATLSVASGTVINVSRGTEASGGSLSRRERYMAAEDTSATVTLSTNALLYIDGDVTVSGTELSPSFSDVPVSHWAYDYIEALAAKGFVNGTGNGKFSPDNSMTRADFVTVLGRVAGVSASDYGGVSFTDVTAGSYYAPYVEWASQNGIVTGIGNGLFAPQDKITRSQMAAIIVRYAAYAGITLASGDGAEPFADDASIESWAREAVYSARAAGIITGKTGNIFDPAGTAARSEVCAIICRLIGS